MLGTNEKSLYALQHTLKRFTLKKDKEKHMLFTMVAIESQEA